MFIIKLTQYVLHITDAKSVSRASVRIPLVDLLIKKKKITFIVKVLTYE